MIKNSSTLSHYLMEWSMIVVIDVVNKTGKKFFFLVSAVSFIINQWKYTISPSLLTNTSCERTLLKRQLITSVFKAKLDRRRRSASLLAPMSRHACVLSEVMCKWCVKLWYESSTSVIYIGFRIAIWRLFCKFLFYNFHKLSIFF